MTPAFLIVRVVAGAIEVVDQIEDPDLARLAERVVIVRAYFSNDVIMALPVVQFPPYVGDPAPND